MSAIERLIGAEAMVRQMVSVEGRTHQEVSEELQIQYPDVKGLTSRSV